MKIIKWIFIINFIGIVVLFGESNEKKGYQIIELEECFIPIDKRYKLIEKFSKYEYNFFAEIEKHIPDSNQTYLDMEFLSVNKIPKNENILQMMKKHGYKQIFDTKFLNYQVFRKKPKYSLDNTFLYVISCGSTYISLTKSYNDEIIKIIEHCERTKK